MRRPRRKARPPKHGEKILADGGDRRIVSIINKREKKEADQGRYTGEVRTVGIFERAPTYPEKRYQGSQMAYLRKCTDRFQKGGVDSKVVREQRLFTPTKTGNDPVGGESWKSLFWGHVRLPLRGELGVCFMYIRPIEKGAK